MKDNELKERDVQREAMAAQLRTACCEREEAYRKMRESNTEREVLARDLRERDAERARNPFGEIEQRERSLAQREADLALRESKMRDLLTADIFFGSDNDDDDNNVSATPEKDDVDIASIHSEDIQQQESKTTIDEEQTTAAAEAMSMMSTTTTTVPREPGSSFKKRKHYVELDSSSGSSDVSLPPLLNKVSSKVNTSEILFSKRESRKPELFSTQFFSSGRRRRSKCQLKTKKQPQRQQSSTAMSRVKRVSFSRDDVVAFDPSQPVVIHSRSSSASVTDEEVDVLSSSK
jgi:hypothetical protein